MRADRYRLRNRRDSDVVAFEHGGISYRLQASRLPDGRWGEVFIDGPKAGSAAQVNARDSAIAASLAFQFGCDLRTLKHALQKQFNGRGAGALGAAIDILAALE